MADWELWDLLPLAENGIPRRARPQVPVSEHEVGRNAQQQRRAQGQNPDDQGGRSYTENETHSPKVAQGS